MRRHRCLTLEHHVIGRQFVSSLSILRGRQHEELRSSRVVVAVVEAGDATASSSVQRLKSEVVKMINLVIN